MNNLSGSYSNLFRDKLDDDTTETSRNNSSMKLLNQAPQPPTQSLHNNQKGPADMMENVYSNIPSQLASSAAHLAEGHSSHEKSDPSLHVYSNISSNGGLNDRAAVVAVVVPTTSQQLTKANLHEDSFKSSLGSINSDSLLQGSSTLLGDDLDLDDPVIAAGSFGANSSAKKMLAANKATDSGSGASANKVSTSISMEMKHVTSPSGQVTNHLNGERITANPNGGGNTTGLNTSNAFISPSRMRLLHDTTMIDTALDLDSLDGSSLGNNSQACLVNKTAIV